MTKGLDPNVPMKNSGVDWIGEIPEGWEVKKAFHYFNAEKGKEAAKLTKEYCGESPGPFNVYSGQTDNKGVLAKIESFEFDYSKDGCLLCSTVGAKAMTIRYLQERFSLSQNCMIITKRGFNTSTKFFSYAFQPIFNFFRNLIPDHMQASFRMEDFFQMHFCLPPLQEQQAIATFLDKKTTQIDQAIKQHQTQINNLNEYKATLINSAVTGKIKVI